jgi:tripartite-type tricarboxylate transporter receptor subunit TctC
LNFATLGDGSFPDLFRQWLNNQWQSRIVGVPYKGGGPAAQALSANEVQVTQFGIGNFQGALSAGLVRILAVSAEKRSPKLPDVPTLAEQGLHYEGRGWWGLAAPKGTPRSAIDRLNAEFVKTFSDPKFQQFLEQQFVVPSPTSPEEFAAFLKEDRKAAENLIKIAKTPRSQYKPQ